MDITHLLCLLDFLFGLKTELTVRAFLTAKGIYNLCHFKDI